jgi:hypothetical protein
MNDKDEIEGTFHEPDGWVCMQIRPADGPGYIVDFWRKTHVRQAQAYRRALQLEIGAMLGGVPDWDGDYEQSAEGVLKRFAQYWTREQEADFDLMGEVCFMLPEDEARSLVGYDAYDEMPKLKQLKRTKHEPRPFIRKLMRNVWVVVREETDRDFKEWLAQQPLPHGYTYKACIQMGVYDPDARTYLCSLAPNVELTLWHTLFKLDREVSPEHEEEVSQKMDELRRALDVSARQNDALITYEAISWGVEVPKGWHLIRKLRIECESEEELTETNLARISEVCEQMDEFLHDAQFEYNGETYQLGRVAE